MVSGLLERRSSGEGVEFEHGAMTEPWFGCKNEFLSFNSVRPDLRSF
jgi:hypothetical protein